MPRQRDPVPADPDLLLEEADVHRLPQVPDRDRVLVALHPDQALPVHRRHPVEPVGRGRGRQGPEGGLLLGQELHRPAPMGLADLGVLRPVPGQALLGEVGIVGEGAPGEEVALHPLHEVLDTTLLLRGPGVTALRVEAHLGGEAPEGRVPPRGPLGLAAQGDGLQVVVHPGPGDPAPALDDLQLGAAEGLEVHLGPPADADQAAVLEAAGQEDPPDELAPEGDPGFAPVPLDVLAGQPLEADDRGCAGGQGGAEVRHVPVERRGAPRIGRGRITPDQLQHPADGDPLPQPARELRPPLIQGRRAAPAVAGRVHRLLEHPGHRVPITPDHLGDGGVALPLLLQELDRAARHGGKHPPFLPRSPRTVGEGCPSRWRIVSEKSWRVLTENLQRRTRWSSPWGSP